MKPIFKDLAKENPDVKFIQVDLDAARTTMETELADVWTIPTFHAFADGKMIKHFSGANVSKLKDTIGMLNKKVAEAKKKEADEAAGKTEGEKDADTQSIDSTKKGEKRGRCTKTFCIKKLMTRSQPKSQSKKRDMGHRLLDHLRRNKRENQ